MWHKKHKKPDTRSGSKSLHRPKLSGLQIWARAAAVFGIFFFSLCAIFVSAAVKPKPAKVPSLTVARGAKLNISMPVIKKDNPKVITLCRGIVKSKCTVLAKNVFGVKTAVKIPVAYPLGDAVIKTNAVSGSDNKTLTVIGNKPVKIIAAKNGGAGGGGGSGNGGGGSANSSDASGSSSVAAVEPVIITGSTNTPTPTPVTSKTIRLINH